jgi:hypothetical protein
MVHWVDLMGPAFGFLGRDHMSDPLEAACSPVGRFQYHFAKVEQKIDQAVIKLFDLNDKTGPIITANVDFAKKVAFVKTSANQQAMSDKDKGFARKTCGDVFAINDVRQFVIHSSFEPHKGGVLFRRMVSGLHPVSKTPS